MRKKYTDADLVAVYKEITKAWTAGFEAGQAGLGREYTVGTLPYVDDIGSNFSCQLALISMFNAGHDFGTRQLNERIARIATARGVTPDVVKEAL